MARKRARAVWAQSAVPTCGLWTKQGFGCLPLALEEQANKQVGERASKRADRRERKRNDFALRGEQRSPESEKRFQLVMTANFVGAQRAGAYKRFNFNQIFFPSERQRSTAKKSRRSILADTSKWRRIPCEPQRVSLGPSKADLRFAPPLTTIVHRKEAASDRLASPASIANDDAPPTLQIRNAPASGTRARLRSGIESANNNNKWLAQCKFPLAPDRKRACQSELGQSLPITPRARGALGAPLRRRQRSLLVGKFRPLSFATGLLQAASTCCAQ